MTSERVLVTGASGYIASHIVKLLLEKGYCVRGTVRSLQNEKKVQPLRNLVKNPKYPLELVVADLNDADSWKNAVTDCDYILHTASPFPASNPKREEEVITPAINGTINVLNACYNEPKIKRVVITSSVVAICGEFNKKYSEVLSELDWPDITGCNAYAKSKTLAEKAAWKFMKTIPDNGTELPAFELCTVNPAYVIGPIICGQPGTSAEIPRRLMQREMPMLPALDFPVIDVRDVALAHYKAMITPDAKDHRHILSESNMTIKNMADILDEEFSDQGYNIPLREAPYILMWAMSWIDSSVNMILSSLGNVLKFDNTRMKCVLGIEPTEGKKSLVDMVYLMIENGQIKKTSKFVSRTENTE